MLELFSRFGRELFLQGVNSSHSGDMSVRAGDRIFITRRGSMLSNLTERDIIETGLHSDNSHITLASTEIKIHRDVYLNTSALAVVHAHPPFAVSLSMVEDEIVPLDTEGVYYFKTIPVIGNPRYRGRADRGLRRSGGEVASPAPESQGGPGQGTRELRRGTDARRGVSVDVQPGGVLQDPLPMPPALPPGGKGGGSTMVMSRCCAGAVRPWGVLLSDRRNTPRKAAKLPAAARYQKGPELSARDADISPASMRSGLISLIALLTLAVFTLDTGEMVASASDKLRSPFFVTSRRRRRREERRRRREEKRDEQG